MRQFARRRAVRRGDRVLKVQNQRVGTGFEAARQFALAIGGDEKQGTHCRAPQVSSSFPRKRKSGATSSVALPWTPAFAGVTSGGQAGRVFIRPARRQIATVSPR